MTSIVTATLCVAEKAKQQEVTDAVDDTDTPAEAQVQADPVVISGSDSDDPPDEQKLKRQRVSQSDDETLQGAMPEPCSSCCESVLRWALRMRNNQSLSKRAVTITKVLELRSLFLMVSTHYAGMMLGGYCVETVACDSFIFCSYLLACCFSKRSQRF